jgi:cytochrome c-type biogenesis protein CcmH
MNRSISVVVLLLFFSFASFASDDRAQELFKELRCVVCEGQSLYDSHALVAQDMKQEIYRQIGEGKTDDEIKAFLVERYGDHILMSTPFNQRTGLLWLFPLFIGLFGGWISVKRVFRSFHRTARNK